MGIKQVEDVIDRHEENEKEKKKKKKKEQEIAKLLDSVVDQVEDIVKEHEKKQHKKDKKKVQKSLVEVEDVIKKQEKPVITSKGDESKKQQEPAILKDVAEQIEDIIVQHDVRPGLDGHDSVQASMGVVVEQVQEVINSGKHEKIVEKQLVNVVD